MKIDQLIRERNRLRAEWRHNVDDRAKIEVRLDALTHDIASFAGLGGLLDVAPPALGILAGGLGFGARRRKRRIIP